VNNIQYDIRKAVTGLLTSEDSAVRDSIAQTIKGVVSYKLYFDEAPQGIALPYVVHTLMPITEERDSASKWNVGTLQFNVYASDLSLCETIAQVVRDTMDDSEGTIQIEDRHAVAITFQSQHYLGKIDGVHNIVLQYSITVQ
jgi:hypothetical protein